MDYEYYAKVNQLTEDFYLHEPAQPERVAMILARCVGSVLDVGGGDGWIAHRLMEQGHEVTVLDISATRCVRCAELGVPAVVGDDLRQFASNSFDTVLLGEILEHLDDPGVLLRDAFRIAVERVVITVPLLGWPDPTHRWRISMDHVSAPDERPARTATAEQIVVTMQRGECWPESYWRDDAKWRAQFSEGR